MLFNQGHFWMFETVQHCQGLTLHVISNKHNRLSLTYNRVLMVNKLPLTLSDRYYCTSATSQDNGLRTMDHTLTLDVCLTEQ